MQAPNRIRRALRKDLTKGVSTYVSRCKGGLARRRKSVGRRHCLTGAFVGRSPSRKAKARSSADDRMQPARMTGSERSDHGPVPAMQLKP